MEQAVQELNSCKRWLESAFSETRIRIDDCQRHYEKFKTLYASKADALKGTAAESEWKTVRRPRMHVLTPNSTAKILMVDMRQSGRTKRPAP